MYVFTTKKYSWRDYTCAPNDVYSYSSIPVTTIFEEKLICFAPNDVILKPLRIKFLLQKDVGYPFSNNVKLALEKTYEEYDIAPGIDSVYLNSLLVE